MVLTRLRAPPDSFRIRGMRASATANFQTRQVSALTTGMGTCAPGARRLAAAIMQDPSAEYASSGWRSRARGRHNGATASDIRELARCTCNCCGVEHPYRETVGSVGPFERITAVLTEALGTVPEPRHGFTARAHRAKLTPTREN